MLHYRLHQGGSQPGDVVARPTGCDELLLDGSHRRGQRLFLQRLADPAGEIRAFAVEGNDVGR